MNENNDNIVPQEEEAGLQSAPEIQLENTETPSETMQTEKSDEEPLPTTKADNEPQGRTPKQKPVIDHRLLAGKLSVYNWLKDVPNNSCPSEIVEVRFKNTRKAFFSNPSGLQLQEGDIVAVEAALGHDIGIVSLTGELVKEQLRMKRIDLERNPLKKVYRKAKPHDIEKWQQAIALEHETMIRSRKIAADLKLNMKIGDVEYQGDKTKAIFYYIAEDRVDFRTLIKVLDRNIPYPHRNEANRRPAGSRANRRHRPLRFEIMLLDIHYQFHFCLYLCCPVSGHLPESSKTGRPVRKTEMLPELRSRCLYRRTEGLPVCQHHFKYGRRYALSPENGYFRQDDVLCFR